MAVIVSLFQLETYASPVEAVVIMEALIFAPRKLVYVFVIL